MFLIKEFANGRNNFPKILFHSKKKERHPNSLLRFSHLFVWVTNFWIKLIFQTVVSFQVDSAFLVDLDRCVKLTASFQLISLLFVRVKHLPDKVSFEPVDVVFLQIDFTFLVDLDCFFLLAAFFSSSALSFNLRTFLSIFPLETSSWLSRSASSTAPLLPQDRKLRL